MFSLQTTVSRALRTTLNSGRFCSSKSSNDVAKTSENVPELNRRPEAQYHSSYHQETKGRVYDKKPFKFELKEGKEYFWCSCGWSHNQPFCDGSHKNPHLKIKLKPVRVVAKETREYWFCNCKQTSNRPFCDGTHKGEAVQSGHCVYKNNF